MVLPKAKSWVGMKIVFSVFLANSGDFSKRNEPEGTLKSWKNVQKSRKNEIRVGFLVPEDMDITNLIILKLLLGLSHFSF